MFAYPTYEGYFFIFMKMSRVATALFAVAYTICIFVFNYFFAPMWFATDVTSCVR